MKLTLFSLPKPFTGLYATIQRNAIQSWLQLEPRPDIILFGDEPGTAEIAREFGLHHEPHLERNQIGTPLVNSLFRRATELSSTTHQCFLNADIIVDPNLPTALAAVFSWRRQALLVSRRWDFNLTELIAIDRPGWFASLAKKVRAEGELYSPLGMDVFIFPTGFFDHMPAFSVGWPGAKYDNWLIYAARQKRIPVVDLTPALTNIHQNHPSGGGSTSPAKAREHWISLDYLGGHGCCFDVLDATHQLTPEGKLQRINRWHRETLRRDTFRLAQRWRYRMRRHLFGFRYETSG
jgi:hypothetical protein